ncbi:MAG: hypothetical protein QOI48_2993 [Solirubrobacteraceae bacterium]|nr:hypothetical protein [Solirubrobacteraceae bacterium]
MLATDAGGWPLRADTERFAGTRTQARPSRPGDTCLLTVIPQQTTRSPVGRSSAARRTSRSPSPDTDPQASRRAAHPTARTANHGTRTRRASTRSDTHQRIDGLRRGPGQLSGAGEHDGFPAIKQPSRRMRPRATHPRRHPYVKASRDSHGQDHGQRLSRRRQRPPVKAGQTPQQLLEVDLTRIARLAAIQAALARIRRICIRQARTVQPSRRARRDGHPPGAPPAGTETSTDARRRATPTPADRTTRSADRVAVADGRRSRHDPPTGLLPNSRPGCSRSAPVRREPQPSGEIRMPAHAPQCIGISSDLRSHASCCLTRLAIGMAGFEPTTPASQTRCSTRLSYIPFAG